MQSRILSGFLVLQLALGTVLLADGRIGESATYRLRWGWVTVGSVEIAVVESPEPGVVEYRLKAGTTSWMDRFLKARTGIVSRIAAPSGHSVGYVRTESDQEVPDVNEARFDWEEDVVRFVRNGEVRAPVPVGQGTQDPLSIVFHARNLALGVGKSFSVPVTDGKRFAYADLRVVDDDVVDTPAGDFACFEVVADLKDVRGIFARPEGAMIRVWVTREKPHLPVKLKSELVIGSFAAQLTEYRLADRSRLKEE